MKPLTRILRPPTLYLHVFICVLITVWIVWASVSPLRRAAPTADEPPHVDVALNGAFTSRLSSREQSATFVCTPSGFWIESAERAAAPFALRYVDQTESDKPPAIVKTDAPTLGLLSLNLVGTPYSLEAGSVTRTANGYVFYAAYLDTQRQPVQLSGRLVCP